jgi:hypothetical protein
MRVRLANPKNAAAAGAGRKPCPKGESILRQGGSKAARERELGGGLADTSRAGTGPPGLGDQSVEAKAGFEPRFAPSAGRAACIAGFPQSELL